MLKDGQYYLEVVAGQSCFEIWQLLVRLVRTFSLLSMPKFDQELIVGAMVCSVH